MVPRLIVASGKHRGRAIPIEDDIVILGTSRSCDVRFKGETVAAKHCQMSRLGARLMLHNLVEADRTLVNGQPVSRAELSHGDTISVGGMLFRIALSEAPLPAPENESVSEELSKASEIPRDEETTAVFPREGGAAAEDESHVDEDTAAEVIVAPSYQVALVQVMIDDMEKKVPFFEGHSALVAHVATAMARRMHLPQLQVEAVHVAGLLHDFGQQVLPQGLMQKKGPLSVDERLSIERHPVAAASKLQVKDIPFAVYNTVLNHHERPDGQGYPVGIRGASVAMVARVLHTSEVYVALTSDRPWRGALGQEDALTEMRRSVPQEFSRECFNALRALAASDALSIARSEAEATREGISQ